MKPHLPNDGADLRARLGELEGRVVALEQSRPRLRLADGDAPRSERPPVWRQLPRGRRVRVDSAHPPRVPHPLLIAVFAAARGAAAYRPVNEEEARPQVLNRVA
jgi:hypothetical protein